MSRTIAVICTLVAGGIVALQPPANAALANHVGDIAAAFVSAVITVTILGLLLVTIGHPGRLSGLGSFKPLYALGGIGGAMVVLVAVVVVRPLGAGGVTALLVTAQLIISLVADRFGWLGLHHVGIGPARVFGLALVIGGTVLITRG
ncbi:MAG: DMT family transporter [Solirubrobacteraceae bacterium]